jgi:hypothetical protein
MSGLPMDAGRPGNRNVTAARPLSGLPMDGRRSSGKQKRDNCRDCTCQHGSTWRLAVVCRREGPMRPPEGSETGRGGSALSAHSSTCGERWPKMYYGAERRRVLLDQMDACLFACFRVVDGFGLIAARSVGRRPIGPLWRARKFLGQRDTGTP